MSFARILLSSPPAWLTDVRVWILVLFLIRLENLNLQPLDEHPHRQTMTLTVTRNMLDVSANPLRPLMNLGEDNKPHLVAIEPSLYNSLIAVSYLIFGENNWSSRLINLLISSVGLWFFYAFLRKFWSPQEALASTVLFAVSVAFIYARKSMPDTFALSFVFMGNYFGANFLEKGRSRDLVWFVITLSIGVLAKMPMVCAAALLLIPFLREHSGWPRKKALILAGLLPATLMGIWYFWWVPTMIKNGGMQLYGTVGLREGWRVFWELREQAWTMFTLTQMKTYAAVILLLPGLFFLFYRRQWPAGLGLLASALLFAIFVVEASFAYPTHEYYGIPFNPVYAMVAGYGLANLLGRWPWLLWLALVGIAVDAVHRQKEDFFAQWQQRKYAELEGMADQISTRDDLFLVNDAVYARLLYFLHRKGRTENSNLFAKHPEWLEDFRKSGMQYLLIEKATLPDSMPYPVVLESHDFRFYRLEPKQAPEPPVVPGNSTN